MTASTPSQVLSTLDELLGSRDKVRPRKERRAAPPNRAVVILLRVVVIAAAVGGWEWCARLGVVDPFFWSMPSEIWAKAVQQFSSATLISDTAYTFGSAIAGFALGTVLGVAIGLSFWWSRTYAKVAEPFVVALEAIPKLALAPIVVLVLGIGISSKIAMATALVVAVQALNAAAGVRAIDPDLTRMLNSLGASRWKVFRSVVVPGTMPWIISGLRVTIGLALAGAIVGEYIGSERGLGRLVVYAGTVYDISLIWVGVVILALLSLVLYLVVGLVERRLRAQLLHGGN
ncbi:ABC transporter permease [Saccharopolyspora sp. K220]|uniref:ABC transporter permease n=1 Tax=Saccharopolyspora soli TaxID=2926618 RepID=UPI001F58AF64|nr:ABC transporter permease [Saccharopolyspora soli]MCI2418406.1 ABC transporter permease [Saccharopolyspora soli]